MENIMELPQKIKNRAAGAWEMAQWLGALPAIPEVLSSIPSNHMVVLQPSVVRSDALFLAAGTHSDRTLYT